MAVFEGLLRSGDAELRVSTNGLWTSYQVWLLKGTQADHFRANCYSQRNGKKMNALIYLKVSLFVRGLLSLSVRNGYCEVASYSLDAA